MKKTVFRFALSHFIGSLLLYKEFGKGCFITICMIAGVAGAWIGEVIANRFYKVTTMMTPKTKST